MISSSAKSAITGKRGGFYVERSVAITYMYLQIYIYFMRGVGVVFASDLDLSSKLLF